VMATEVRLSMRTGDVARAAGVNQQTVRYYERRGLLAEPDRSTGGHRLYPPEAVSVLRVIKAAQRLGFTLDEVADLLEVGRHPHHRRHVPGLQATPKLNSLKWRHIDDLRFIQTTLLSAIDANCGDLVACADSDCCPLPFADIVTTRSRSQEATT
jgi:DNA-binding transcriptional MerR regulator